MEKKEILNKIIEIYENIVGEDVDKEKFTLSSNIKEDLGINSVGLLYLIVDIENKFDVVLHNQSIEKFVTLDDVVAAVKAGGYKKVVLQPLMVVAGDHANNDMAGDEEDSWKSAFEAEGLEVECSLKGLGSIKAIQDIYVAHTAEAVKGLK